MSAPTPIALAFSGGLDTSFCVPYLAERYARPVITVTVDTGGLDAAGRADLERRALALGAERHLLVDARRAFFDDVLRFLIFGNVGPVLRARARGGRWRSRAPCARRERRSRT